MITKMMRQIPRLHYSLIPPRFGKGLGQWKDSKVIEENDEGDEGIIAQDLAGCPLLPLKSWFPDHTKMHRPRSRDRKQTSKQPRRRRRCNFCPLEVEHLARHLRQVHDWSAKGALEELRTVKIRNVSRPLKTCPMLGCNAKTVRIDVHLRSVHKTQLSKTAMKVLLQRSHKFDPDEASDPEDSDLTKVRSKSPTPRPSSPSTSMSVKSNSPESEPSQEPETENHPDLSQNTSNINESDTFVALENPPDLSQNTSNIDESDTFVALDNTLDHSQTHTENPDSSPHSPLHLSESGSSQNVDQISVENTHGRRCFSKEQVNTIVTSCQRLIDSNCSITIALVKHFLMKSEEGETIFETFPIKKLTDRVRTARRYKTINKRQ